MRLWEAELGEEPAAGLARLLVRDPGTRVWREQGAGGDRGLAGSGCCPHL